ncbi:unnamed protein product, partial [Didymodactylos carnosus]
MNNKPSESIDVTVKAILQKYDFPANDIDDIVLKLISNFDQGLKLIEDELTPSAYKNVESDLISNEKIRSITGKTENSITLPSIENKNAELLQTELDKVWKKNNFKTVKHSLYIEFVQCLLIKGIEQAATIVANEMIKKHIPILIDEIENNDTIQNIINNSDNEKIEKIQRLQTIMLGNNENYSDELFSTIEPLNFESFQQIIKEELDSNRGRSLLDVMLPYIINKLKKGIDLYGICTSQIFWKATSPLYGMD